MSGNYFKWGKPVRTQTRWVLLNLWKYFTREKDQNAAESVNERMLEATGVSKRTIQRVIADGKEGVFGSPTKKCPHEVKKIDPTEEGAGKIRQSLIKCSESRIPALKEITVYINAHCRLSFGLINITGLFRILKKIGFSCRKSSKVERTT